jgi:uncharacterized membrane protein
VADRGAFGDDPFGRFAEKMARFFGTPRYIIGQTIVVALWIVFNSIAAVKASRGFSAPQRAHVLSIQTT